MPTAPKLIRVACPPGSSLGGAELFGRLPFGNPADADRFIDGLTESAFDKITAQRRHRPKYGPTTTDARQLMPLSPIHAAF